MEIKDEYLSNYLNYKLDKNTTNFTEDELSSIDELFLDCNELKYFKLSDLELFSNLKRLVLRNFVIKDHDFYPLLISNKLQDITFDNCTIYSPKVISGLTITKLSLINCDIKDINFVYILDKLTELTIIRETIDIKKLNKLENLRYLQISYCNVIDNSIKLQGLNIEKLYIDNTNIIDLNFLNKLYSLKLLSIDENQYTNNKELIDNLKDEIEVLLEGIGDLNE